MTNIADDNTADRLLTTGEAAARLGIDGRTLIAWVQERDGPKGRMVPGDGRALTLRFSEAALAPFVEADYRPDRYTGRQRRWWSFGGGSARLRQ